MNVDSLRTVVAITPSSNICVWLLLQGNERRGVCLGSSAGVFLQQPKNNNDVLLFSPGSYHALKHCEFEAFASMKPPSACARVLHGSCVRATYKVIECSTFESSMSCELYMKRMWSHQKALMPCISMILEICDFTCKHGD